jgi:hypothetical protein
MLLLLVNIRLLSFATITLQSTDTVLNKCMIPMCSVAGEQNEGPPMNWRHREESFGRATC